MERDRWRGVELRHVVALEAVGRLRSFGAAARELDLTFADLPLPEGPFESDEVLRDPYVLIVAADSELATRDTAPPLREVSGLPLIGWRSTGEPETYLRGRVPELNVVFRTDDNG